MFTHAKDIAVTATDKDTKKNVDIASLVSRNLGQQVPTEAIPFARQHAEHAQTQAQTKAHMTEMRQGSLLQQPRVNHRSEFAPLANVTGITVDATKRSANENIDSDAPPKRGGIRRSPARSSKFDPLPSDPSTFDYSVRAPSRLPSSSVPPSRAPSRALRSIRLLHQR